MYHGYKFILLEYSSTGCLIIAFINLVNYHESEGLLTAEQADELRQQAQAIQDAIGCDVGVGNTLSTQDTDTAAGAEEEDMMTTTTLPQSYSNPDNVQSAMSVPQ